MKTGLEFEFPLVTKSGRAASYEDNLLLWQSFQDIGYQAVHDSSSGKIIGASKKVPNGSIDVGTDYGTCTFEVALPPEENLTNAQQSWHTFLNNDLLPILHKHSLRVLGLSQQPKSTYLKRFIAPKGHYAIWAQLMDPKQREWVQNNWPGFCASQSNIDVSLEKIIDVANVTIKLTPLLWALSANGAVASNDQLSIISNRIKGFLIMAKMPLVKHRVTFPQTDFYNIYDYIDRAWQQPIFEIIRDGKPLYPKGHTVSTWDFIERGEMEFFDLDGKPHMETITVNDLNMGLYFYWLTARIKIFFDEDLAIADIVSVIKNQKHIETVLTNNGQNSFIELRPIGASPQNELLSWPAFFTGMIQNIDAFLKITKDWDVAQMPSFCENEVLIKGLQSKWNGKLLSDWAVDIYKLSLEGLAHQQESIQLLQPIERRFSDGVSPTDDARAFLENHSVEEFIDSSALN